jgi:protein SCO1/2
MKDVERRLQEEGHNLQMIAVSVAPEDDQPEVLKTYAQRMQLGQTWRLLTGDRAQIYSLARDTFAAEAFDLPISKGQVAHSEHLFVVDGQRRLRGVLNGTKKNAPDRASELMAKLSQETESVIP